MITTTAPSTTRSEEFFTFSSGFNADVAVEVLRDSSICVLRQALPVEFVDLMREACRFTFAEYDRDLPTRQHPVGPAATPPVEPVHCYRLSELQLYSAPNSPDYGSAIMQHIANHMIGDVLRRYFATTEILVVPQMVVVRRQLPGVVHARLPFHQDVTNYQRAEFLNVWIPFETAGERSAGLELLPVALSEQLAVTNRGDSFHPAVEIEEAEVYDRFGRDALVRPVLDPGDVLIFNQHTVHRTFMPDGADLTRSSIEVRVCDHFNPTPY